MNDIKKAYFKIIVLYLSYFNKNTSNYFVTSYDNVKILAMRDLEDIFISATIFTL
jgi:hypothetical protein